MNDFDVGFRVGVEKAPSYKENQELRDEIERLRGWESARPQLDSPQYLMDQAADEIERLRGLLKEAPKHAMTENLRRRVKKALGNE